MDALKHRVLLEHIRATVNPGASLDAISAPRDEFDSFEYNGDRYFVSTEAEAAADRKRYLVRAGCMVGVWQTPHGVIWVVGIDWWYKGRKFVILRQIPDGWGRFMR